MTLTPDRPEILPGAEPFSAEGGPAGALVLHGFTGTPQSMRGVAEAFAAAGFAVELPLLPGHGTSVEDMAQYGWNDWVAAAEEAYDRLGGRCSSIVVVGLSMGGALTAWMAARHPEIRGIVCINPGVKPSPPEVRDLLRTTLEGGTAFFQGPGNDIADPEGERELAYEQMSLAAASSFFQGQDDLEAILGDIRCPVLIITSRQDHVVEPSNSDYLAERVSGPVERVWLERSFHVATLDYDKAEIESRCIGFARKVTAG
jgi:carboxylesterase